MKRNLTVLVTALAAAAILLSACGARVEPTPTIDPSQKKTEIAQTVAAELTRVVALTPSATITPSPTVTQTPTVAPSPTLEGGATATVALPTLSFTLAPTASADNYSLVDEDPKDDKAYKAGESVKKKWVVKNTGTTTWNKNYKLIYLEGPLGKTNEVAVGKDVKPSETVELFMEFTAPNSGTSRSYWKMMNDQGRLFGESVWIEFRVSQ